MSKAREIAETRFAKGEITEEEFRIIVDSLGKNTVSQTSNPVDMISSINEQNTVKQAEPEQIETKAKEEYGTSIKETTEIKNSFTKKNIDLYLIWIGFLLFLLCLILPSTSAFLSSKKSNNGYENGLFSLQALSVLSEALVSSSMETSTTESVPTALKVKDWLLFLVAFAGLGNILIALSPLFLFLKKNKMSILFGSLIFVFFINAMISGGLFYNPENDSNLLIGYYIWVMSFFLVACGYFIRHIKLSKSDLSRSIRLILSFISLSILVPGLLLPALSLEGVVHKAKAMESSKVLIVDAIVEKGKDDALKNQKPFTDADIKKSKAAANSLIDSMLSTFGLEGDKIEGTIKVYEKERSILTAVNELYKSGYGFVAFLVVFFSAVIPIVKLLLIIAYSIREVRIFKSISNALSKWSMVDVFAIAIMVAFLAANSYNFDGFLQISAKFEIGFYFFLAYCLLSISSSRIHVGETSEI